MGGRARAIAAGLFIVVGLGCSKAPPGPGESSSGGAGSTSGTSTSGTTGSSGTTGTPPQAYPRTPDGANPVAVENQKPGDGDWYIQQESDQHEIEGYTSDESVEAGQTLDVMVSVSQESDYAYAVYRLGYYGGQGARKVLTGSGLHAKPAPACPRDPTTSLVECDWPVGFSIPITADFVGGVYFIKLHRADGHERYVPFVVRDHRAAEVLFKISVATDAAYNRWGGESLYFDGSHTMPNGRAYMTSFDRPYDDGAGAYSVLWWERHMVRYLEQAGYDVTYGTSVDVARFSGFYDGIGAIVAAGHDEYWTATERDATDAALASGKTSLVNLSANPAYWRIRLEPDAKGRPYRRVVCYKNEQSKDPALAQGAASTSRFRDGPDARPENGLYGSMYEDWALMGYPLTISDVSHPFFAGTGFKAGDIVPDLVGYEYDRMFDNGATPAGTTAIITSPLVNAEGWPSTSQVVTRTTPQGRIVFSSGTIYWPLALSDESGRQDTRIWNFTWNVLEAALAHRHTPRPPPGFAMVTRSQGPVVPKWAHTIAAFAGQAGVHQVKDGPVSQASFQAPVGLAVGADGAVYVADSSANVIRMIKGGQVSTIAGTGVGGLADGPGAQAMFNVPTGLALGADGAIYVADSQNHVVRRIANDAPHTVTTYAGTRTSFGGYADGPGAGAKFFFPMGLAFDATTHVLYVADEENNLIRAIAPDAAHTVSTFAGTYNGYADGPALSAAFNFPTGVTVGPDGTVYVLDTGNARIRRIARSANPVVETITGTGEKGFADGWGSTAKLQGEDGILWMPSGVLWTDSASNRVRQLFDGSPGALATPAQTSVTTFAGDGRVGTGLSTADTSSVVTPAGIAVGPHGELYVSDTGNAVIRVLTP